MRIARCLLAISIATCLLPAASCGGQAVIDEPSGGGGSGHGGASASSSASSGSSTSSSSATGGPATTCEQACGRFAGCLASSDCVASCDDVDPACSALLYDWLDCVVGQPDPATCDWPTSCAPSLKEYVDCAGLVDESVGTGCATGPIEGCSCFVLTYDQVKYQSNCDDTGTCSCLLNDVEQGTCIDDGDGACDPLLGCCAAVFFVDGA